MSKLAKLTHEVCIVGCGPVGLTLANCLALSPQINSIALIDRKLPKVVQTLSPIPHQRVYSINGPSLNLLERLNVLSKVRRCGHLSHIQVITMESNSFVEWPEDKARILENDELVNSLLQGLSTEQAKKKIQFIEDQVQTFQNNDYSVCELQLSSRVLKTKLLVGSDGNQSKVKQLATIPTYGWSYRQKAIVCTLKMQPNQNSTTAQQIYYEGNVLALLPLWEDHFSIVWSLQLPEFEQVMQLSEDDFVAQLNKRVDAANERHSSSRNYKLMQRVKSVVNKRLAFPLSTLQAERYSRHRLALIGDAAHTIHPMAGLGVNSGIFDSVFLANNIILNKKTGNDIGEAIALSAFQSKSKAMNYANSLAMETIKKTFEINLVPLNLLRGAAMNLLESTDYGKELLRKAVRQSPLTAIKTFQWEHP